MMSQFSTALPGSLSGIGFGKEVHWFVSHVDQGSGIFYLQQNDPSVSVKYERQMQDIEASVSGGSLESFGNTPPPVGCVCIAQYSEDNQWYRGQILGFLEDDSEVVEVVFIDYGNGETLSWKNLRKVPKEFTELPPQAIQCKLANVEPVGGVWGKEGVNLLKELILDRELVGIPTHLCKSGAVVVKLYADEEKSAMVAEQLVMAGFAYWKKLKSSLSRSSSSSSSSASLATSSVNGRPGQLGTLNIKVGSYFDLCISHIDSIDSFYCQPVGEFKKLDEMTKEMQRYYNSDKANDLKIASLKANQLCCARYSEDAVWYRAVVKKVSLGQNYEVQFVDFGNSELLPMAETRELTSAFTQLPISCVHCLLHGTRPGNGKSSFDDNAIQKFEELTGEKQLVGYASKMDEAGRLAVVLFDTTNNKDGININMELSKVCNIVCDKDANLSPTKSISSKSASGTGKSHFVSIELNTGLCDIGYVAFAQSPFDFSCQLSSSASSLENMMHELNEEYLALKPGANEVQTIEAGAPCCARYSGDGRYYRAELKSVMGTNAVVHFVDYGNDENCRLDEIKHLRKEYLKLPKQAFKCKLADVQAPGGGTDLPPDSCAQFNDMVIDKEFKITIIGVDSQGVFQVSLIENNDRNVVTFDAAKVLVDSDLVEPLRKLSKEDLGHVTTREQFRDIKIPNDDYIDIMPTHITNPNEFCCQLLENSDKIDTLMADLENTYKDSKPNKSLHLKNGMPCVALYSADENWYRGLIVHVSGQDADVNYVDFGNSETLRMDKIRLIHSEFMHLPAQAFVCSLSDVIPRDGHEWSKDAVGLFSDLTLEKQLIASVIIKDESNLHHVELLDTQTNRKQQTNIGDVLIEKGFAQHASKKAQSSILTNGEQQPSDVQKKSFVEIKLKPQTEETVYVSHIDDLDNIYCQLTKHEDSLYKLLDKLNMESAKYSPLTTFSKGTPLCAMFSADSSWYRGEVIMVVDNTNALVRFVDYGNSENVEISSICEVPAELLNEPKYGILCSLYSGGMKWKEDAVKELLKITTDKVLKMTVKEIKNGKYIIDLYDQNEVNISSALVQSNQPLSQNTSSVNILKEQAPGNEQASMKEMVPATKQSVMKHGVSECLPIKPGLKMDCFVSFIESLKEFYVQPCNVSKDLDFVSSELVKVKSVSVQHPPKKGDICCALYELEDKLYRAEIIQITDNQIEIFFFDYGNSEVVEMQNIKPLPKSLLEIPRLSIRCSLYGVMSQSDDDIDTFSNSVLDHKVSVEFMRKNADGRFDVKLEVNGSSIKFDKARKDPGLHVEVKETAFKEEGDVAAAASASSYSAVQSPAVIVEFNEKELKLGATEKVYVCYVVTAQEFYCQLSRESDALNNMMTELEEYYGSQPPEQDSLVSLAAGLPCAAKYSVDGCWYRAALQSLQGPTQAKVMFVDYGNAETVGIKDLKVLTDAFYQFPTFAIRCSLMGDVGSAGDFESKVIDKEFDLKVVGLNGGSYIVDLISDGSSLSTVLSENVVEKAPSERLQTPAKEYNMAEIEEGSTVDVYYLDGKSPQEFFCHLAKYETEFETLVVSIGQMGDNLETLKSFEIGTPCVALFSEDGCWYRGRILELKEDNSKVEFVDYGNKEFVKNVNIKVIPDVLLKLPMQAVRLCLDNVCPASGDVWTTDEITLFQNKCDQKLLSATISSSKSDVFSVVLRDKESGKTINETFGGSVERETRETNADFEKLRFKSVEVDKGMTLEALCTFVKENCELSCQLVKYESELNKLMDEISVYCDGVAKEVPDVRMEMACLALYDEDQSWYRGKVMKADGKNVTIRFVDFGNESVCALENLRMIRPKDLELPVTCIDCKISGVDVSGDIAAVIEEICLDQEMIVNVKDVVSGDLVLADLLTMKSKESVLDMINKAILDSNDDHLEIQSSTKIDVRQFEKITLDVGESETAICTAVTSLNVVNFQVLRNQNEFNEMMQYIAIHCEESENVLKERVKGQSCLGKYSVDGEWYRAEVVSVSNDQMRLRFVDYGNEDDVALTDTREMIDDFMKLPALSITCKLHGVDKEGLDFVKAVEWLENSCIENEFKLSVMAKDDEIFEVSMYCPDSLKKVEQVLYAKFGLNVENTTAETAQAIEPSTADTEPFTVELNPSIVETDLSNVETDPSTEVESVQPEEKSDIMDDRGEIEEAPSLQSDEELQYTKVQVKMSVRFPSVCSFIDDRLQIHCQPTEYSSELDQLMAHIADYCREMKNGSISLDVGVPCFALFSDDGEWYRAEVVKVDGDICHVFYVDYGNHGMVKKDEILSMTKPFLKLPKTCFACILQGYDDLLPIADDVKVWLEERLIGEELEVELTSEHNDGSYFATLYHNGKDVGDAVKEEFRDIIVEKETDGKVEKADVPPVELKAKETIKFTQQELSCHSNENAVCTYVASLHEVFVQLTKYKDKLYELSEKMQAHCSESSTVSKDLENGSSCLAKFSLDDQWYRAEVIEIMKDSVKVQFIDYGNTDIVALENTRALCEEFVSLPATSLKCHLHDVHQEDIDSKAAVRWLEENVVEQEINVNIVDIIGDSYDCILKKEGSDDVTINDQLYYEFEIAAENNEEAVDMNTEDNENETTEEGGTVAVTEDNENETQGNGIEGEQAENEADTIDKCASKEVDGNDDEIYVGALKQQTPKLGAKESVKCTHVESLNCISIQLLEFQEKFDEMFEKISEFCKNSKTLPETFERGNVCLAKSEDGEWYRAEISSVSSDSVDVHFVDYGNTETVLKQDTRPIQKEFASLPAMSVLCQLHDLHENDIDVEKAEEWLHENLVEQEIDIEIIGKIDETYDVIIMRKNESVSVNGLLFEKFECQEDTAQVLEESVEDSLTHDPTAIKSCEEELNPNATDFVPSSGLDSESQPLQIKSREIIPGSSFKVHLSFHVTPSAFWCQFDDSCEDLLEMMAEIDDYYGNNDQPPFESTPEVGTICCAQFSEDSKWYRGEVCETFDDKSCTIHFLDYGNVERVELNKTKELQLQFYSLPKQAIKCSLDGVGPVDKEWSEEATVVFEDTCADRILDVEIVGEGDAWNVVIKRTNSQLTVNQMMVEKGFGINSLTEENTE